MSDQKESASQQGAEEQTAQAASQAEEAAKEPSTSGGGEPTVEGLTAELETANAALAEAKDQLLRTQAEAENVRRRAQRDVENARKYALDRFVGDLLPVVDSLEKAIETSRERVDGEAVQAITEGLELCQKLFLDVLGKAGIQQIDPTGKPFDPQYHEAMSMVPSNEVAPNSVLHTMQKGYLLHDRLLRAAMVMVAKGDDSNGGGQGGGQPSGGNNGTGQHGRNAGGPGGGNEPGSIVDETV